ncbi:hypothetical protein [Microbacterium mangrovi]|uniref:hypothetical protein n=1 Tax=Microbacterium mangrovi TaxID=1348253 RepID=UPI0012E05FFB|nr:hypothetical protein [Microbacterium mangrovi]
MLTIFGAALVTAGAGFAGAAIQGRREHNRWVRQERLAAYLKFLFTANDMWDLVNEREKGSAETKRLQAEPIEARNAIATAPPGEERDRLLERIAHLQADLDRNIAKIDMRLERWHAIDAKRTKMLVPLDFLGPTDVAQAARRVAFAINNDPDAISWRLVKTQAAMRRALGIKAGHR